MERQRDGEGGSDRGQRRKKKHKNEKALGVRGVEGGRVIDLRPMGPEAHGVVGMKSHGGELVTRKGLYLWEPDGESGRFEQSWDMMAAKYQG